MLLCIIKKEVRMINFKKIISILFVVAIMSFIPSISIVSAASMIMPTRAHSYDGNSSSQPTYTLEMVRNDFNTLSSNDFRAKYGVPNNITGTIDNIRDFEFGNWRAIHFAEDAECDLGGKDTAAVQSIAVGKQVTLFCTLWAHPRNDGSVVFTINSIKLVSVN